MMESLEQGLISRPKTLSAMETWQLALTRPNEEAYQAISDDPSASLAKAVGWIVLSSGVAYLIGAVAQLFLLQMFPLESFMQGADEVLGSNLFTQMSSALILLCGLPLSVLMSLFGVFLVTGLIHFITTALGGNGSFEKLFYTFAAISAPATVVSALLGLIPIVNCLTAPLALYVLVLNILATKVVHKVSWGAAMGAYVMLIVLFGLVVLVIGLALWGPLQEFLRSPEFLPSGMY